MKFIYPAVFHKTEEGHYKGYFPDLECCYGEGETLDDAIESANEAARDWITLELSEDDPLIPYVSDIEDIEVKRRRDRPQYFYETSASTKAGTNSHFLI